MCLPEREGGLSTGLGQGHFAEGKGSGTTDWALELLLKSFRVAWMRGQLCQGCRVPSPPQHTVRAGAW